LANWMHSKNLIYGSIPTWNNYFHLLVNWMHSKNFICECVLITILVYSSKHFSIRWSITEYSWRQQCLQVEHPTMLINNVKHVSTKKPFSKHFWHRRFFNWHIVKTLISVQPFWWHHQHTYMDDKMY
jgi:hypothetical protein